MVHIKFRSHPLQPCVTVETANQLDIDFGTLLEHTKIPYADRQPLLKEYSVATKAALQPYGIQFLKAIKGRDSGDLFWLPEHPIEQTLIQFGNAVTGLYSGILRGLASGEFISDTGIIKILQADRFGLRF